MKMEEMVVESKQEKERYREDTVDDSIVFDRGVGSPKWLPTSKHVRWVFVC